MACELIVHMHGRVHKPMHHVSINAICKNYALCRDKSQTSTCFYVLIQKASLGKRLTSVGLIITISKGPQIKF